MSDDAELYTDMQSDWFWEDVERREADRNKVKRREVDRNKEDCSRVFLVDYENVSYAGLNGLPKLAEDDLVRIYYSAAADRMTFGLHRRIMASDAMFEYVKVGTPIQNAVDCRILFDLEDLFRDDSEAEYYIVSKDTDYDKAIDAYRNRGLQVKRIPEIAKLDEPLPGKPAAQPLKCALPDPPKKSAQEKREAQVRTFFEQQFKDEIYKEHKEEIIQIILTCETRQAINNALTKIYPGEIVSVIFKTIRPLIGDYPGK